MKTICKYQLDITNEQEIEVPGNVISVCEQQGGVVIYAMVDTNINIKTKYKIYMMYTGNPLPDDINNCEFLDTVNLVDGALMLHVFYKIISGMVG